VSIPDPFFRTNANDIYQLQSYLSATSWPGILLGLDFKKLGACMLLDTTASDSWQGDCSYFTKILAQEYMIYDI
jgi:hypothetical protein